MTEEEHPWKGKLEKDQYAPCGLCPKGLCDHCFECSLQPEAEA